MDWSIIHLSGGRVIACRATAGQAVNVLAHADRSTAIRMTIEQAEIFRDDLTEAIAEARGER